MLRLAGTLGGTTTPSWFAFLIPPLRSPSLFPLFVRLPYSSARFYYGGGHLYAVNGKNLAPPSADRSMPQTAVCADGSPG